MFRRRDFDLVTVSTNYPDERPMYSRRFNNSTLPAVTWCSPVFASEGTYALQAAVDSHWVAGVPVGWSAAARGFKVKRRDTLRAV
jgi:hypothetical protein